MRECIALFAAGTVVAACSIADIPGDGSMAGADAGSQTAISTSTTQPDHDRDVGEQACVPKGTPPPPAKPDWHTFPACACNEGGKARCVPNEDLPSGKDKLAQCNGGACVPDTLLETKTLKACNSSKKVLGVLIGQGRCLSLCVPDVADKKGLLDRGDGDTCAEDERCAPCFDNRNGGTPTGLCDEQGQGTLVPPEPPPPPPTCVDEPAPSPKEDAGTTTPDPTPTTPCCGGKGACVPRASVPSDARWILDNNTCAHDELCAPPASVAPIPCTTNVYSGFCNDSCVIDEGFPRGSCASGQKCVPCDDDGDPTRVPGCAQ